MSEIGHNGGPGMHGNEERLAGVLRKAERDYCLAALVRREAAAELREIRKAERARNLEAFQTIEDIMSSAREKMQARLRDNPGYVDAEERKKAASADMKAATKFVKENGLDIEAFKITMKMKEKDEVERAEFFDQIDISCKLLRLWGGDDF